MTEVQAIESPPRVARLPGWLGQVVLVVAPLLAFAAAWWLLALLKQRGFFGNLDITDTPVYRDYGAALIAGKLPYRDFGLEYPPLALPTFLLPALTTAPAVDVEAFTNAFHALMFGCGLLAVAFVALTLRRLTADRERLVLALGLTALSPVLVGTVITSHFDLWPAALTAVSLAAMVWGHQRLGAVGLGLATMAKVYPAVIVPVLVIEAWRRRGRREALICLGLVLAVVVISVLPFALVAPNGIWDAIVRQINRPLQIESLGGALLIVGHGLTGLGITVETSFGSQNVAGPGADLLLSLSTIGSIAALIGVWAWFARGPLGNERLITAAVASVCAYVAFGKVFSPQYMVWLVPLVPLVGGRRGLMAGIALAAAMILTQSWFPVHYFDYVNLDAGTAWLVLARDLAVVGVAAAVILPSGRLGTWAVRSAVQVRSSALAVSATQALLVLLAGAFLLRALWITLPAGSLIFDEAYYVNAARVELGWTVPAGQPYVDAPKGVDPNTEHPPLGKAVIAASMTVFGDNGLGWRLPSIIAGVLAIAALYGIVVALGGSAWLALLAAALLALDNLSFVHGRIGTLDMMAACAMLVGAWLAVRRRPALAGVAMAVASLIRITSIFGLLALLLVEGLALFRKRLRKDPIRLDDLRPVISSVVAYVVVGLVGLYLLDLRLTTYTSPFDHLAHMFGYGLDLRTPVTAGITSPPWQWIVGQGTFDYMRVDVNAFANGELVGTHPAVEFQGAISPILLGAAPLAILYGLWLAWRSESRVAEWGVLWLTANWLPFFGLAIFFHRVSYLYYILPAIPALAVLIAVLLTRIQLPRVVVWGYLALSLLAFISYFPFRDLPPK